MRSRSINNRIDLHAGLSACRKKLDLGFRPMCAALSEPPCSPKGTAKMTECRLSVPLISNSITLLRRGACGRAGLARPIQGNLEKAKSCLGPKQFVSMSSRERCDWPRSKVSLRHAP